MGTLPLGFAVIEALLAESVCEDLARQIDAALDQTSPTAGTRNLFQRCPEIRALAHQPEICKVVASVLGNNAFAVRAILFDKTTTANWLVSWHQDAAFCS